MASPSSSEFSSDIDPPPPPYIREQETLILDDPRNGEILINHGLFHRRPSQSAPRNPLQHNLTLENIKANPAAQAHSKTLFSDITSPIPYALGQTYDEDDEQRDPNCQGFTLDKENVQTSHSQNYSLTTASHLVPTVRSPKDKPPLCPEKPPRHSSEDPPAIRRIEQHPRTLEGTLVTWRQLQGNSGLHSPQPLDLRQLTLPSNADLYRTDSIERQHFNTIQSTEGDGAGPGAQQVELVSEPSIGEEGGQGSLLTRPENTFSYKSYSSQMYNVPDNSVFNSSQHYQLSMMSTAQQKQSIMETEGLEGSLLQSSASYLHRRLSTGSGIRMAPPPLPVQKIEEEDQDPQQEMEQISKLKQDPDIPRKLRNKLRKNKQSRRIVAESNTGLQETAKFKQKGQSRQIQQKLYLEDGKQDKSNSFLRELLSSQIGSRRGSSLQVNFPEQDTLRTSSKGSSIYAPFSARKAREPSILDHLGGAESSTYRAESTGDRRQKDSIYERLTKQIKESVLNELEQLRSDFNNKLDELHVRKEESRNEAALNHMLTQNSDLYSGDNSVEFRRETMTNNIATPSEPPKRYMRHQQSRDVTPQHFMPHSSAPYPSSLEQQQQPPLYPRHPRHQLAQPSEADMRSFSVGTEVLSGNSHFIQPRSKASPLQYQDIVSRKHGRCLTPSSIAKYYTESTGGPSQQVQALYEQNMMLKQKYENELRKKAKRRARKLMRMKERLMEQERMFQEQLESRELLSTRQLQKNADTQTSARQGGAGGGFSLNLTSSSYEDPRFDYTQTYRSPMTSNRPTLPPPNGEPMRIEPFSEVTVREVRHVETDTSLETPIPPPKESRPVVDNLGHLTSVQSSIQKELERQNGLVLPQDPYFYEILRDLFCEISMDKSEQSLLHKQTLQILIRELFQRCGYTQVLPLYSESVNILLSYKQIRDILGTQSTLSYSTIVKMVQSVHFLRFVVPYITAVKDQEVEMLPSEQMLAQEALKKKLTTTPKAEVCDNMLRQRRGSTPQEERVRAQVMADKANLRAAISRFRDTMNKDETEIPQSAPISTKSKLELELEQAYQKSMAKLNKSQETLPYYSRFTQRLSVDKTASKIQSQSRTARSQCSSFAVVNAAQTIQKTTSFRTETKQQEEEEKKEEKQEQPDQTPSKGDFLFPQSRNHSTSILNQSRSAVKVPELKLANLQPSAVQPAIVVLRPQQLACIASPYPQYFSEGSSHSIISPQILFQSPLTTLGHQHQLTRHEDPSGRLGNTTASAVPHDSAQAQSFVNDSFVMDTLSTISLIPSTRDILKHARTPPRPVLNQETHLTLLQLLSHSAIEFSILSRLFMGDTMQSAGVQNWSLSKAVKTYTYFLHRRLDKKSQKRQLSRQSARSVESSLTQPPDDSKYLVLLHIGDPEDLEAVAKHNKGFEGVYGSQKEDPKNYPEVVAKMQFLNDMRSFARYLKEMESQGESKVMVLATIVLAENCAIETSCSLQECLEKREKLEGLVKMGLDGVLFEREGVFVALRTEHCVPAYFLEFES